MDTQKSLYEIEVAIAKTHKFNYLKNIVVFNVNGISEKLPIFHECDVLILSKSGYLTEIEIKRSWSDFIADFKKKHKHNSRGIIKYFYYCIPENLLDKVRDKLAEEEIEYTGIITYNEDLFIKFYPAKFKIWDGSYIETERTMIGASKLYLEQQLELARLGTMRVINLKEKLIKVSKN